MKPRLIKNSGFICLLNDFKVCTDTFTLCGEDIQAEELNTTEITFLGSVEDITCPICSQIIKYIKKIK